MIAVVQAAASHLQRPGFRLLSATLKDLFSGLFACFLVFLCFDFLPTSKPAYQSHIRSSQMWLHGQSQRLGIAFTIHSLTQLDCTSTELKWTSPIHFYFQKCLIEDILFDISKWWLFLSLCHVFFSGDHVHGSWRDQRNHAGCTQATFNQWQSYVLQHWPLQRLLLW